MQKYIYIYNNTKFNKVCTKYNKITRNKLL